MRSVLKKIWFWLLGVVISLGSLGILATSFTVTQIECSLNDQSCPDQVIKQLDGLHHQPLFFTDFLNLGQSQLDLEGEHQITSISKKLPHTLIIQLQTTPTQYQLLSSTTDQFAINQIGKIRKIDAVSTQLPIVRYQPSVNISPDQQFLSTDQHYFISTVLIELQQRQISFKELNLTQPTQMELTLEPNLTVYLDQTAPATQIKRLEQVLTAYPFALPVTVVDVRYKLPVLK